MTKRFSAFILMIIFSGLCLSLPLFCENGKWIVGAQKFTADAGLAEDSVNQKTGELLPSDILEKIGYSVVRNVIPDEQFDRTRYKLRTERQSLFLQLSAEYKKRDSLVLSNYSELKLKSAISDSQKKIKSIQKKLDANLTELKKAQKENEEKMAALKAEEKDDHEEDSELLRFKDLFEKIFVEDESLILQEQVTFYRDDFNAFFEPNEEIKALDPSHALYEKQIVSAGINTLITGHFSRYGDYISVYVDMYNYPGAKKIGSVAEVGSVQEMELVTTSIAMQLVPYLANSFPVQLELEITPAETAGSVNVFMDDTLQNIENGSLIVDSGIHTIQFICEGYKTAGTTYNFEGNKKYKIQVNLEKPKAGYIQVGLRKPIAGDILMNGERALEIDGVKSQIAINGKEILGEFISEDGETAFFYIPKRLTFDGSYVTIKPKPMDRMSYIDKRRKIMYASYSLFVVSLIPTFYTYGNYTNYVNLYTNYQTDYETAKKWQDATNVTRIISITCGVLWGYELVRYLLAANKVLPQNARAGDLSEYEYYEPPQTEETSQADSSNDTQDKKNGDN